MAFDSFTQQDTTKIDSKCRIVIPSMFRAALGEEFRISLGLQNCLYIMDNKSFKKISRSIASRPMSESAKIARRFNAFSFCAKPDKQGRVVLPPPLRNALGIDVGETLVLAGLGPYIEVWRERDWIGAYNLKEEDTSEYMSYMQFDIDDDNEPDEL